MNNYFLCFTFASRRYWTQSTYSDKAVYNFCCAFAIEIYSSWSRFTIGYWLKIIGCSKCCTMQWCNGNLVRYLIIGFQLFPCLASAPIGVALGYYSITLKKIMTMLMRKYGDYAETGCKTRSKKWKLLVVILHCLLLYKTCVMPLQSVNKF